MAYTINIKCKECKEVFQYLKSNEEILPSVDNFPTCHKRIKKEHEDQYFIQLDTMTVLNRIRCIERILYKQSIKGRL